MYTWYASSIGGCIYVIKHYILKLLILDANSILYLKVHMQICPFFGHPNPPAPCTCPLRQAWGSLDALIGRLRAAFEENGGSPETNPFGARAVRLYLREVRDSQAKARGISYEKKKRKRPPQAPLPPPHQPGISNSPNLQ